MEGIFAGNTDPVPYITASYVIGCALIFGMPVYFHLQSRRLSHLLASLKSSDAGSKNA
jgi:hypothetical protein